MCLLHFFCHTTGYYPTLLKEMCSTTHTVLSLKCKLNRKTASVVHCEDFGNGHSMQNNLHTHTEKL